LTRAVAGCAPSPVAHGTSSRHTLDTLVASISQMKLEIESLLRPSGRYEPKKIIASVT
jgi:hypothetical protein